MKAHDAECFVDQPWTVKVGAVLIDEYRVPETVPCVSVGFLIADIENAIAIAPNLGDMGRERTQASGIIRIPRSAVRQISAQDDGLYPPPPMSGAPPRPKGTSGQPEEPLRSGNRREVITFDEGDVVISFPENLFSDSFGDLRDHLDLFIKTMQRRADRKDDEAAH